MKKATALIYAYWIAVLLVSFLRSFRYTILALLFGFVILMGVMMIERMQKSQEENNG